MYNSMNKAPLPTSYQKLHTNSNSARPPNIPDYFVNSSVGKFSAQDYSEENDYAPFINYEEEGLGKNDFMPKSSSFAQGINNSNNWNLNASADLLNHPK